MAFGGFSPFASGFGRIGEAAGQQLAARLETSVTALDFHGGGVSVAARHGGRELQLDARVLAVGQARHRGRDVGVGHQGRADAEGARRGIQPADHAAQLVVGDGVVLVVDAGGEVLAGGLQEAVDLAAHPHGRWW